MSGGSMGNAYSGIRQYAGDLCDKEMTELALDLAKVFRDAEWWHSSGSHEKSYRKTVGEFKQKWFKEDRNIRLRGYIDEIIEKAKIECYNVCNICKDIGEEHECSRVLNGGKVDE